MSPEEAKKRYGEIILGEWTRAKEFCKMYRFPDLIAKQFKIELAYVNKDIIPGLENGLRLITEKGLIHSLMSWNGCFSPRFQRGNNNVWSLHSWAIAFDINAKQNPLGAESSQNIEMVKCWKESGFNWGGDFKRKDPMHFEWNGLPFVIRNSNLKQSTFYNE